MQLFPIDSAQSIIDEYNSLSTLLSNTETISSVEKFKELSIKENKLRTSFELSIKYINNFKLINETKSLIELSENPDDIELYKDMLLSLDSEHKNLSSSLISLQAVQDSLDSKNAILEIRAGTGGEEASLFALDIYKMYLRYSEINNWVSEQLSMALSNSGGIKEIILNIKGINVYGKLKYESGIHRVQRVPATESAGRIHTSAISVVVLPEIEENEVEILDSDLRIDVFRAGGPGGQSVNTTDSAVRITHLPTGITVSCQDEKSQLKNKNKALKVLKSRVFLIQKEKQDKELSNLRKDSIKSGDRSDKIRTYNFPQSRVTDHRINKSWHDLSNILNGNLHNIISELSLATET
jgi:peptide chain release factor 1